MSPESTGDDKAKKSRKKTRPFCTLQIRIEEYFCFCVTALLPLN